MWLAIIPMSSGGDMAKATRTKHTGMGSFYGAFLFDQIVLVDHVMRALKELFDSRARNPSLGIVRRSGE